MAVDTLEPRGQRPRPFFTPRKIIIYSLLFFISRLLPVPDVRDDRHVPEKPGRSRAAAISSRCRSTSPSIPGSRPGTTACTGLYCEGLKVGFLNSVKITIPSVIVSVLIASINGYALVNWRFKGSEVFFVILLFGSFIPYQVMLYPLVIILREMHMFSTLQGVILIHTVFGMPILTLLFRNYFASLPPELFKAARVDGAGFWRIFFQIMVPMSLPIFVVAMILQITGIWNDFLFGVIFAGNQNYPMTVQLNNIVNSTQGVKEYNVNMAATILTGLVPLAVYFISGKWFVRGIAAGAVKG